MRKSVYERVKLVERARKREFASPIQGIALRVRSFNTSRRRILGGKGSKAPGLGGKKLEVKRKEENSSFQVSW